MQNCSDWLLAEIINTNNRPVISVLLPQENNFQVLDPQHQIIRCVNLDHDDESDNKSEVSVYWLIQYETQIYQCYYNPRERIEIKVKSLIDNKYYALIDILKHMSVDVLQEEFSLSNYDAMCEKAKKLREELSLTVSALLTEQELTQLECSADKVVVTQLTHNDDGALDHGNLFDTRCNEAYLLRVSTELRKILGENTAYTSLKKSLIAYLQEYWKNFAYTTRPAHPVTQLLIKIAERLSYWSDQPAIRYLMPEVFLESLSDAFPNLDELSITDILKTHILDTTGQYLIPVSYLLNKDLLDKRYNPYYNLNEKINTNGCISVADIERLYQHSQCTRQLYDVTQRYLLAATDQSHLLGQLNILIRGLAAYDAHGGMGRDNDAASLAYPLIMSFMNYYGLLNQVGFLKTTQKPSLLMLDGYKNKIVYVLCTAGDEAGLYLMNQLDNSVQLICNNHQRQKFSIDLISVYQFEDINKNLLSERYPTLIYIQSMRNYMIYGMDVSRAFVLKDLSNYRIEDYSYLFSNKNPHTVTLPVGNVPAGMYQTIADVDAHIESKSVVDALNESFSDYIDYCTLEQLNLIQAHTGHCYLLAYTQVPESIRILLSNLWGYIQNPAQNNNATRTIATCIGRLREGLQAAMNNRDVQAKLEAIRWDNATTENQCQQSQQALVQIQNELRTSLEKQTYQGIDTLPPTPSALAYLGVKLQIDSPAKLKWFYTFPPESISAFLFDNENTQPRQYIEDYLLDSPENLLILLNEAPTKAYVPLLSIMNLSALTFDDFIMILSFLPEDKKTALLDVFKDSLSYFIKSPSDLVYILCTLSENQCKLVLEMLKDNLSQIITNAYSLKDVLSELNENQCKLVLEALKDNLSQIITGAYFLSVVLSELNENQCKLFLEVQKDNFSKIIKDASTLIFVLQNLNINQRKVVLELLKGNLSQIITNANGFRDVFKNLEETQHKWFLEELKDNFSKIITSVFYLKEVLWDLNDLQRNLILDGLKGNFSRIITSANGLRGVLDYLNETQRNLVLDGLKGNFSQIITSAGGLRGVLDYLNETQSNLVLDGLKGNFSQIITSAGGLSEVLRNLNETQRNLVLDAVKGNFSKIITSAGGLSEVLRNLNETQSNLVLDGLKGNFSQIITSAGGLSEVLRNLNETQRNLVLDAVKGNFSQIITSADDLSEVLENLNETQRSLVLGAVKGNFSKIITSAYGLRYVLQNLNETHRSLVLEAVKGNLSQIITRADSLRYVLQNLNETHRSLVLGAVKGNLSQIITNAYDLRYVLQNLNETQCKFILESIKNNLSYIILSIDNLSQVIYGLDVTQCNLVLEALKSHFRNIIFSKDDLANLLHNLDTAQCRLVLNAIKGKLPGLIKGHYTVTDYFLVEQAKKAVLSRNGFFSTRGSDTQIGSLEDKLDAYIRVRKNEYIFHWDFFNIIVLFYWLFGIKYHAQSRDTKIAAATHVLESLKGERKNGVLVCQFECVPENVQDLEKNSYFWSRTENAFYFVDQDKKISMVALKDKQSLADLFKTTQENKQRWSFFEIENKFARYCATTLPTTAQYNALKQGLLGDIIQDAGGINEIMALRV